MVSRNLLKLLHNFYPEKFLGRRKSMNKYNPLNGEKI
jgi:hypothetical protein